MNKVSVFLSAYNGEQYISEQLDSILRQRDVQIRITVRDDGSSDDTIGILESYAAQHENITYYRGQNKGPALSFLDLIASAKEEDANIYYAFCDQDDVWDEDKLQCAIHQLNQVDKRKPCLYYSKVRIVDASLGFLGISTKNYFQNNKYASLIECPATGCTEVFNSCAFQLIKAHLPQKCLMHDYWVYMVCKLMGNTVFDTEPHLSYRQHTNNVIGMQTRNHFSTFIKKRLERMKKKEVNPRLNNAMEFYRCFGNILDDATRESLEKFIAYKKRLTSRLALAFNGDIIPQEFPMKYKLLALAGML